MQPSDVPIFSPSDVDPALVQQVAEILQNVQPAPGPLEALRPPPQQLPFAAPTQTSGAILEDLARAQVAEKYGIADQDDLALLMSPEGLGLTAPEPFVADPRLQVRADRDQQLLDIDYNATVEGITGPEVSSEYTQAVSDLRAYVQGLAAGGTVDGSSAAQQILNSGTSRANATQAQARSDTSNLLGGFGASPALAQPTLNANAGAVGAVSASAQEILDADNRYNERIRQAREETERLLGPVRAENERFAIELEQDALTQAAIEYSIQSDAIRDGLADANAEAFDAWQAEQTKFEKEVALRKGARLEEIVASQQAVVDELEELGIYGFTSQSHTTNANRYIVNALTQSSDPLEQRGVAYALLAYESVMGDQAYSPIAIFDAIDEDPRFTDGGERTDMRNIVRQILGLDSTLRRNGVGITNIEAELPPNPLIAQLAPNLIANLRAELEEAEVDPSTIATPQTREP